MLSEKILTHILRLITQNTFKLKTGKIPSLPKPKPGRSYLLYIHIPFCDSLCPFCSFNRFVYQENTARKYFAELREEMRMVASLGYQFNSLYFGGGTPTILLDELITTIDLARELFPIKDVSCETNPNQLDPDLAEKLAGRVQRLSVGVQSFNNGLLQKINRLDRFGNGEQIAARIRKVSGLFQSLNVDMIFNFPGQSAEILQEDIIIARDSGANQVTFYPLMSSPSVMKSLKNTVGVVSFEHEGSDFNQIRTQMSTAFESSTAWTYSKKNGGLIDEYIVDSEEYVGIGSGAFSYLDGVLYVNNFSLKEYGEAITQNQAPIMASKKYGLHDQMRYRLLMDLFGLKLDKSKFSERFGIGIWLGLPLEMIYLWLNGALDLSDPGYIKLTPKGQYLFVVMMREFFIGINTVRDQARSALPPGDSAGDPLCIPIQNC